MKAFINWLGQLGGRENGGKCSKVSNKEAMG